MRWIKIEITECDGDIEGWDGKNIFDKDVSIDEKLELEKIIDLKLRKLKEAKLK